AYDAAGLSISNRMTSQINGLNQAVRNANDGVSMIQTAEGALDESTNILQRMRELSVQSANGTYQDGNRGTMNAEVQQLKAELDRISDNTTFNGLKLLDGSQESVNLQVGADSGQNIEMKMGEISTSALGVSADGGVSATGTDQALANGDLVINGVAVGASKAADDTASTSEAATSSIAKAAAINAVADQSGVSAVVDENEVAGSAMTGAAASGTVTINGTAFSATTSTDTTATRAALVETINQKSAETGITATDSGEDSLGITLSAADGRNIEVSFSGVTNTGTGIAATDTYSGGYTLVANAGTDTIEVSGGNGTGGGDLSNAGLSAGTYSAGIATVTSTSQVAAGSLAAAVDATESSVVSFTDLAAGESVSVGGLTYTSAAGDNAAAVAFQFSSLVDTATPGGQFSGTLTGFSTGANSGSEVTFTSSTANSNVSDLDLTASTNAVAAGAPSVGGVTQGVTGVAEEFTSLMGGITVAGADSTLTFDGEALTLSAGVYTATQVADALAAQIGIGSTTADGNWTLDANDGAGTLTWTATATGATTVVAGDFVYADGDGNADTVAAVTPTETIAGVTEAIEQSTMTFSALAAGESVTVDGLTYTSTGATSANEVAGAFANLATNSTPADLATGTFSGQTSANFTSAAAAGNTVQFTATAAGAIADIVVDAETTNGLTVTTTQGSTATVAGAVNYDNLDAGDLVVNGTSIREAKASDDTASYDGAISSSKEASGIAIAAAINDATAETGVTATANATEVVGTTTATNGTAAETGTLHLNGVAINLTVQGTAEDNRSHAVDQINAVSGQTGVVAEDNGKTLTLTAADGRNIVAAIDTNAANAGGGGGITGTNFGLSGAAIGEADITAGGAGDTAAEVAATTYSSVSLSSASTISVDGSSNGKAGVEGLGLKVGDFGGASSGQFLKDVDISTAEGAQKAIDAIDNALEQVNDVRSEMGAVSNRLDFTVNNLSNVVENTSAARSRIEDADFAAESANLSRAQVLQQAGTAMLAQANAAPQSVLSLLQ
uniref:flagellin N-terminal helical domain-containing protein n=1 Tax=Pontibacterium sp. TaxID=2036026 RepID=UPI0035640EDD